MTPLTQAISTALVDFLWQGATVGALLWMTLIALRHRSAQERYLASCLALCALSLLPVLTVVTLLKVYGGATAAAHAVAPTASAAGSPSMPQTLLQIWMVPEAPRQPWLDVVQRWALPAWTAGVVLFAIRLVAGWLHAVRLRRRTSPSDAATVATTTSIATRIGIARPVRVVTASLDEGPSVIGWLRPTLLLPPATAMGLTTRQLEAVIAHELAHIKRHDYLVNLLQVIVESLFFYHPVVWWTSRCIRLEREVCCDDIAVRSIGDATGYARALTSLAKQQLAARLAMAAAGGPLLYRVQHLLGRAPRDVGPAMLPGLAAIAAALGAVALNVGLHAQATPAPSELPRFDVTSVKENRDTDRIIFSQAQHGRVTLVGHSLRALIQSAYQVQEFQIIDGPDWIDSVRFTITATYADDPENDRHSQGPSRRDLMMRALLADRFGLAVRKDTGERPVFALVPSRRDGKLGAQLRPFTGDCATAEGAEACGTAVVPGYIRARGTSMAQLATAFSRLTNTGSSLNRLVVDRSELNGLYDVDLRFTPDRIPGVSPDVLPEPLRKSFADRGLLAPADPNGPSIFTAVQEQLGLKLDPQRVPVDVLVIDRVHRPTED